jgi:predicted amidohydrolase
VKTNEPESKGEVKRRPAEGIRVAVAQIYPRLGDVTANLELHRAAAERARAEGAAVLVFPELALTGYRLKDSVPDVALTRDDPLLGELAELSQGVALVAGFVEETREHHFFNVAGWFAGGRLVYLHRKAYLPTYGMFDEQRYFARGRRIRAFDSAHGRAAILVCEDMLHPTAATIAALDGAETIYVPSASPVRGVTTPGEVDANGRSWESYIQTIARALGVFVVYANRVGVEDGHTFWGGSAIVAPDGAVLAKAAYYEEDFITAVLPEGAIRRRRMQSPALRDEDLDLTINELERIRERLPSRREQVRPERSDRGRGDDARRGRYSRSGDGRRSAEAGRDTRGRWHERSDGRGQQQRGRWQERDQRGQQRGRWQERDQRGQQQRGRWQQRDEGRGPQRGYNQRQGDDVPRRFDAESDEQPPARYRPDPAERRPRPLGGEPPPKDTEEEDES